MNANELIGRNVRAARERAGLSAAELARRCGWERPRQSKLEHAQQAMNVEDLVTIAAALGVAPVWLLADHDGDSPLDVLAWNLTITRGGDALNAWLVGDRIPVPAHLTNPELFYGFAPLYGRWRTKQVQKALAESGELMATDDGGWTYTTPLGRVTTKGDDE